MNEKRTVSEKTIGQLVAEDYRISTVFEKYGIDFCCGGQITLAESCRENGLDPEAILREIEEVKNTRVERKENYATWALPFLADYIVNIHHAYLNENTEKITEYLHKTAEVHGANHPEVIEIAAIFDEIATDMAKHLREEEEVLFPALKRIHAAQLAGANPAEKDREMLQASLATLQKEHDEIGDAVHKIRHLAKNYQIPEDACNTFMVSYSKLKEFEEDLHKHVHLENNILFQKAAQL